MREYITTTTVGTYTTWQKYGYPQKFARWQRDDLPIWLHKVNEGERNNDARRHIILYAYLFLRINEWKNGWKEMRKGGQQDRRKVC